MRFFTTIITLAFKEGRKPYESAFLSSMAGIVTALIFGLNQFVMVMGKPSEHPFFIFIIPICLFLLIWRAKLSWDAFNKKDQTHHG